MGRVKMLGTRIATAALGRVAIADERGAWGKGRGSSRPWARKRQRILERDMWTCQVCGIVDHRAEVDHIIPISRGGGDDDINLQAICHACHVQKTARERRKGSFDPKEGRGE